MKDGRIEGKPHKCSYLFQSKWLDARGHHEFSIIYIVLNLSNEKLCFNNNMESFFFGKPGEILSLTFRRASSKSLKNDHRPGKNVVKDWKTPKNSSTHRAGWKIYGKHRYILSWSVLGAMMFDHLPSLAWNRSSFQCQALSLAATWHRGGGNCLCQDANTENIVGLCLVSKWEVDI